MKSFQYVIKDELGLHARPAGLLAKLAKNYTSEITITKGDKTVVCTKLMAMMGMCVKKGDTVTVAVNGVDEDIAFDAVKNFFETNL